MGRSLASGVLATLGAACSRSRSRRPGSTPAVEFLQQQYRSSNPGQVGGRTAAGATLSGEWEMGSTNGTFRLTLAPDACSFTGTWQGTGGRLTGESGNWRGTYLDGGTPRPSARVTFSVTQDGVPTPARGIVRSRTTGSGSAAFPLNDGPVQNPGQNPGTATGSVVHSDERIVGGKRVKLRITVRLTSATYRWAPALGDRPLTRVLEGFGKVVASSDPECPANRLARFVLRDAGATDGLNVLLQLCRTHSGEQHEVWRKDRVRVQIRAPSGIGGA